MRPTVSDAVALVAVAVMLAGSGCGQAEKPPAGVVLMAGQVVATSRLRTVAAGLCDAAELARRDVPAAQATFFGQSHEGLHLLAGGLQDHDRAAAAAVLEAKQKVEADFTAPPSTTQLVDDLHRLADVTRSGLARFEVEAPACPPR